MIPIGRPGATERLAASFPWHLRLLFGWAFTPVQLTPDAANRLERAAAQGPVVVVARSSAFAVFVYLQHLLVRLALQPVRAVLGLGSDVWRWWWWALAGREPVRAPGRDDVDAAVRSGGNALVFLRKPGSLVAAVREVADPFPDLVRAQRTLDLPIQLVPMVLVWERTPVGLRRNLLDVLFGEPEAPGLLRSLFSLVRNRTKAVVKFGEPIDLKKFLEDSPNAGDAELARKVRGVLHVHLARQTRVVTGPPLKSAARIVAETLRDRSLRATLAEISRERGVADGSVEAEAARCLREIAATYSPRAIDFVRWVLDWVFSRIYDGVDVDERGIQRVAEAAADAPIVVCPSHKSHIDYLMMSWVFFKRGLNPPHIAAGINLAFWPLGSIFRRCGAFFIRRSFKGDRVYSAVMKAYVRKLLKDGFPQEFFVEGARSRNGKVLQPKFGMLNMEVDAWIDGVRPDIAFVPAWIGYEKMIEAKSYARELEGAEKKAESIQGLLKAPKVLVSRYGRIYVRVDEIVSLAKVAEKRGFDRNSHTEEERRALVKSLGYRIVEGINRVTALTPMGLLCTSLLSHDRRGLTAIELRERMAFLLRIARDEGAELALSLGPSDEALDPGTDGPVREAIALLQQDKSLQVHVAGGETVFQVPDDERVTLDFQKNTALHWWVPSGLLAASLLTTPDRSRAAVHARTRTLSRLLKQEFIYGAGGFDAVFDRHVERLERWGHLSTTGGQLQPTETGQAHVRWLAGLLVNYLESYALAGEAIRSIGPGGIDGRELTTKALEAGRAAFLAGRLRRRESLSKLTLENAFAWFEVQGLLVRTGEKGRRRALAPGVTAEQVAARVDAFRSFIPPAEG